MNENAIHAAIHAVADQLFAATGKPPTLIAIRKAMGGGSFTTIGEAMKTWRSQQATAATPVRESAPAAITERVGELVAEVWGVAMGMASSRLASEREALDVARKESERARMDAVELADHLVAEMDAIQNKMQEQAATSQAALVEAQKRAEDAQKRADSLARMLESERDMTREAWTKAENALTEAAELKGRLSAMTQLQNVQSPLPLELPLPLANGQALESLNN